MADAEQAILGGQRLASVNPDAAAFNRVDTPMPTPMSAAQGAVNIDPMKAQAQGAAEQASTSADVLAKSSTDDAMNDKAIASAAIKAGNGNLVTPDGIHAFMASDSFKNLSPAGQANIADLYGKKIKADKEVSDAMLKMDENTLTGYHTKIQTAIDTVIAPGQEAYAAKYSEMKAKGLNDDDAQKAAEGAMHDALKVAAQTTKELKGADGKPIVPFPFDENNIEGVTKEQFDHLAGTTDYMHAKMVDAMDLKAKAAKVALEEAQAKEALHKASGDADKVSEFEREVSALYPKGSPQWQAEMKKRLSRETAPTATQINLNTEDGRLTPEGRKLVDALAEKDGSFMSRMGVKNLNERNRIINDWAASGKTADDIIGSRLGLTGSKKEIQVLSGQKAGIERAEGAITRKGGVGDQVVEAAKKVDPSKFKAYNKVSQFLQSEQSDRDLAAYQIKLLALRDEYASVINKGGTPTDASRAQANEAMDRFAPNATGAIVQAVKDVVASNKAAIDDSIRSAEQGATAKETSTASKGTISKKTLSDYAVKHKMQPDEAAKLLKENGYTIE